MQTSRITYRLTKTQPPFSREEKVSRENLKKGVETGNYYYGARYYDPKISVWLSVDPLAHKYPSLSPYVFTGNIPIMLVDSDGRRITCPKCPKTKEYEYFHKPGITYSYSEGYGPIPVISKPFPNASDDFRMKQGDKVSLSVNIRGGFDKAID